jgi:hypothetical protein
LQSRVRVVQSIPLAGQSAVEISAQVDLETKTVSELIDLKIWGHEVCVSTVLWSIYSRMHIRVPLQKTKFFYIVVITKLSPRRDWFSSCRT